MRKYGGEINHCKIQPCGTMRDMARSRLRKRVSFALYKHFTSTSLLKFVLSQMKNYRKLHVASSLSKRSQRRVRRFMSLSKNEAHLSILLSRTCPIFVFVFYTPRTPVLSWLGSFLSRNWNGTENVLALSHSVEHSISIHWTAQAALGRRMYLHYAASTNA